MPLSTAHLKNSAKQIIRHSKPSAIYVGAVYCILNIILSLLSSRLINAGFTAARYEQFVAHMRDEHWEYALRLLWDMMPGPGAVAIYLLLEASISVVSVGFVIFLLRTVRRASPSYGNLLDGFGFIWRILLLDILVYLLIFLWSLLLFIPGIIASYSYCLSTFLLIDHPEYSVLDCIRESKRMMQGHKTERFLLDISFIGWVFLISLSSVVPGLGILAAVQIWTVPYMNMTFTLYYEILRTGSVEAAMPGSVNDTFNL